jgi:hypothetical protein
MSPIIFVKMKISFAKFALAKKYGEMIFLHILAYSQNV